MRVLHVVPSFYPAFAYGGTTTSVRALCAALVRKGCELQVLTTDANGLGEVLHVEKTSPVDLDGFTVRYFPRIFRHSVSPRLLWQLLPAMRWADIVHLTAVYNFPTLPTMGACRWLGKPLVWSPRGALQRWHNSRRPALKAGWEAACRWLAPPAMVLHVTSSQEAVESGKRFPAAHAFIIPNGVDVPGNVEHCEGDGTLRLVFLGRLDSKKGIENLLAACASLEGKLSRRWSLIIAGAGDPSYASGLHEEAGRLGLGGQVKFAGEVRGEAKTKLFEGTDLAVFPSHTENFAMVVAEALAHGVPVIASRGTPWAEVENHACGLWVDNDPASLAEAITRMASMPLEVMGARGRQWMQRDFSWDGIAEAMVGVYGKLVRNFGRNAH